jgi:hypothetical protein
MLRVVSASGINDKKKPAASAAGFRMAQKNQPSNLRLLSDLGIGYPDESCRIESVRLIRVTRRAVSVTHPTEVVVPVTFFFLAVHHPGTVHQGDIPLLVELLHEEQRIAA